MKTIVTAAALAIAATFLPGEWLELRPDASLLRVVTCHFTHWSFEQLAWDALAFTALGLACARRNARATYATLLASLFVIPAAVLAFAPDVIAYRGIVDFFLRQTHRAARDHWRGLLGGRGR